MEYLGMFYCAYPDSGEGDLAYWNLPMEFPLSMTKVEATEEAAPALASMSVKKVDLKEKTMKKIQNKEFIPRLLK